MSVLKEILASIGHFFNIFWPVVLFLVICGGFLFYSTQGAKNYGYTTVVRFDGCEYLKTEGTGSLYTLTHKGNCTNH